MTAGEGRGEGGGGRGMEVGGEGDYIPIATLSALVQRIIITTVQIMTKPGNF